jgi:hypothetical protein
MCMYAYTCIYILIYIYAHIRIYIHIHFDLGKVYIHTYTYIYIHILTSANHGLEVFSRGAGRRHLAAGWTPTGQICCDRPLD